MCFVLVLCGDLFVIVVFLGVILVMFGFGRDLDMGFGVNSFVGFCFEGVVFVFLVVKVVFLSVRVIYVWKGGIYCEGFIGCGIGGR